MSPKHQFDVAVVGDNTIDRYLDEPDRGDLVGGNALNVAVQLAMLGIDVAYFGAVGTDENALIVREAIRRRKLGLEWLVTMEGATALTTIRRRPDGDRVFEHEDFGVTDDYFPDAAALAAIAAARWVHVGMLRRSAELGRLLADSAATVSQDCSVSPDHDRLGVSFASAGDAPADAERVIADALASGAELAVATLGAAGARAGSAAERWQAPTHPAEVVDTTGAGDSFMAGFIAARLGGSSVPDALSEGTRRGAFTCGYVGGWPQLADDIERHG
jgi:fructoselysine 6-kinase